MVLGYIATGFVTEYVYGSGFATRAALLLCGGIAGGLIGFVIGKAFDYGDSDHTEIKIE
jgi:tetrahydromethanopterin S-methyltransferase subunit F